MAAPLNISHERKAMKLSAKVISTLRSRFINQHIDIGVC